MHIPSKETQKLEIMSFDQAMACPYTGEGKDQWIYVPPRYLDYRYILGTKGKNPLICVGINPSTAEPGNLDNTLKSVERISKNNGFDSFIMFNVYPQRATVPDDMDREVNEYLRDENLKAFEYVLSLYGEGRTPTIWASWGTIIEKRPYLTDIVLSMIEIGEKHGAVWYSFGKISKKGHPHHPLYLRKDEKPCAFDARSYCLKLKKEEK